MRKFGTAAIILLLAPTAPALAQKPDALTAAMTECAVNPRDAERLACYDAAIAETSSEARTISKRRAEETAKIVAAEAAVAAAKAKAQAEADAIAAAEAAKNAFGDESVRTKGKPRFTTPAGQVDKVESTVTETLTNKDGFGVYLLENGQLWREVDKAESINTRAGDAIYIERTALGGYKLHFVRQKRVILVKRLK